METKVAATSPAPEPKRVQTAKPADAPAAKRGAKAQAPAPVPVAAPVEMRLVIEMDQASGSYVYKTVNRLTGEVVQQLPRAEVLRLKDEAQYAAGSVISTEA
ncbi:MAG: flagellar protein FlaG [Phenylobacterium sp.]|uniref:flagellar protein FlaG n=1 Tax=Phenylobacterium sp. TaxID=1871053 RepID=UPI001A592EC1|nr:flagellar protein FlaG [Phenylobacterium sp.]MBL8771311.1 flagellar protein FlaG [Phenylobacterium sp.]